MAKRCLVAAAALLLVAGEARAQDTPAPTPPSASAAKPSGNIQSLSPGEQRVARALFLAQQPRVGGAAPLSLYQITVMKQQGQGWGDVFKQMKANGLIQAKALGDLVSARDLHEAAAKPTTKSAPEKGRGDAKAERAERRAAADRDALRGDGRGGSPRR